MKLWTFFCKVIVLVAGFVSPFAWGKIEYPPPTYARLFQDFHPQNNHWRPHFENGHSGLSNTIYLDLYSTSLTAGYGFYAALQVSGNGSKDPTLEKPATSKWSDENVWHKVVIAMETKIKKWNGTPTALKDLLSLGSMEVDVWRNHFYRFVYGGCVDTYLSQKFTQYAKLYKELKVSPQPDKSIDPGPFGSAW